MPEIEVTLNGESRQIPSGLTVRGLLSHLELHPGMIVVEHNRRILRKEVYDEVPVRPGDSLELVQFVGGG